MEDKDPTPKNATLEQVGIVEVVISSQTPQMPPFGTRVTHHTNNKQHNQTKPKPKRPPATHNIQSYSIHRSTYFVLSP